MNARIAATGRSNKGQVGVRLLSDNPGVTSSQKMNPASAASRPSAPVRVFALTLVLTLVFAAVCVLGGCALGMPDTSASWRQAKVIDIVDASEFPAADLHCVGEALSGGMKIVVVGYRVARINRRMAFELPPGTVLKEGDPVMIQAKSCSIRAGSSVGTGPGTGP